MPLLGFRISKGPLNLNQNYRYLFVYCADISHLIKIPYTQNKCVGLDLCCPPFAVTKGSPLISLKQIRILSLYWILITWDLLSRDTYAQKEFISIKNIFSIYLQLYFFFNLKLTLFYFQHFIKTTLVKKSLFILNFSLNSSIFQPFRSSNFKRMILKVIATLVLSLW